MVDEYEPGSGGAKQNSVTTCGIQSSSTAQHLDMSTVKFPLDDARPKKMLGTLMFLIALGAQRLASWDGAKVTDPSGETNLRRLL